jgi:hypothetical protein
MNINGGRDAFSVPWEKLKSLVEVDMLFILWSGMASR